MGLFLKLAHAPVGSWRHLAFIAHHHMQTAWFSEALADLCLVLPGIRLIPIFVDGIPFLSSSGVWSDEDEWLSLLAYGLPISIAGRRFCPQQPSALQVKRICNHVHFTTQKLRTTLTRQHWSTCYESIVEAASSSQSWIHRVACVTSLPEEVLITNTFKRKTL